MNKLTAEKCRERIKKFKRLKKQFGIAMETELSLQAFEIALPILEQQERGEDEWIEWGGGNRPVAADMQVEVRFRDGKSIPSESAAYWNWHQHNSPTDIIAYRIIPERATNQNGEQ